MNEETRQYWKADYSESCTISLEEGSRSSTPAMGQLVGFLSYAETLLYVIWNLNVSENCQITCIMWTWDDQRKEQFHIIENKVSA
jgi:hypothetical protein